MKPVATTVAIILMAVTVAHVLRLVNGWQVSVADEVVPMWASGAGAFVAGTLAVLLWRESRKP